MRLLLTIVFLAFAVSACGTKGPLYIPERQYPQTPAQKQDKPKEPQGDVAQ